MTQVNTKLRLLEAAVTLFSDKGFNGVSINDICKLSDANIASVNYYFGSKQKLYDEAWIYAFQQTKNQDLLFNNKALPPDKRLKNFIESHVKCIVANKEESFFSKLLLREFAEKNISNMNIIFSTIKPLQEYINQILRELINDPSKESSIPLLRFTLMSQCMMPLFSPVAKEHIINLQPETTINHIYNVIMACIKSDKI